MCTLTAGRAWCSAGDDGSRVVSEQDRSRLYAWLCEQVDDSLAEYVMSCLAPAPLSDLVTRDFLSAELAQLAAVMAAQREADRAEAAAQREADRAEAAAQREADRAEAAEMRAADSEEWTRRFRWLIGAFIGMTGVVVSAVFGAAALA